MPADGYSLSLLSRVDDSDEWSRYRVRFGRDVLLVTPGPPATTRGARPLARELDLARLHLVVQVGNRFEVEHPEVPVLYRHGRYLVVDIDPAAVERLTDEECSLVELLRVPDVVFEERRRREPPVARGEVIDLLRELSVCRVKETVEHLVSLGTRQAFTGRFDEAAIWAARRLSASACSVRIEQVKAKVKTGLMTSWNVIGKRCGTGPAPRDTVVVMAHLDSINREDPEGGAPGADDNATGATGTLEIARCLAPFSTETDIEFVLFGAEEPGLFGSKDYVRRLGEQPHIRAAINMDMIGTHNGTSVPTVMIESDLVSASLSDQLEFAAHAYTALEVQTSAKQSYSDHVPFIRAGLPAVMLIEGNHTSNGQIHSDRDTVAHIDFDLTMEILRTHLAFLVEACGVAL